ncbi:uncharacterized protein LOC124151724 [Haliotis rufescens]|uniref:uncharacterized protein LOC124151724 n=1 Tax=Haliotis rufescens TaxID=6454 RepID=UPI001EB04485|nr:uncharacterized protein LOC124151724 [Haliotis rufescens]
MPEWSRMLAYVFAVAALSQCLIKPTDSTETRAAFWDNAAGRQPYKKRDMQSLSALLSPPDRSDVTVEDVADLISQVPAMAKALVQRFVDRDGDGLISEEELMDLWK